MSSKKVPNQLLSLALTTIEEVMGKNGINTLLNYTKLHKFKDNYPPYNLELEQSSDDFARLLAGTIDIFGEKGARPILFRGGMRSFEIMHDNYPILFNIEGVEPTEKTPERLFDEFFNIEKTIVTASTQYFGDIYRLYECDEGFALENHDCYWCKGVKAKEPVCHAAVGFHFGIANWVTGQKIKIVETLCSAVGDDFCKLIMHRPKT